MTALTCSRKNSSTSSTLPETRTAECWYGLEGPRYHLSPRQLLHHRCHRSSRSKTSRHQQPLRQHCIPQTQKDGSSRSCSVIWWIPPNSPPSLTPKTGVTWY